MPRTKECSKCGGDFPVMRYRGFQAPEGGCWCGVHGPSGSVATSRGYSCGLPESSASLTGTDADVSAVARGVVGGTEESSASLMGTSEDVCFSPSLSRRKRGRVATGTPVRAAPNSSCNESNESVDSFRQKRSLGKRIGSTRSAASTASIMCSSCSVSSSRSCTSSLCVGGMA